ncbi:MAG: hypothetical protein U5L11_12320 [Arhodomonas sp.]|nr:hypothetical protein [Arhodomonas sp.]
MKLIRKQADTDTAAAGHGTGATGILSAPMDRRAFLRRSGLAAGAGALGAAGAGAEHDAPGRGPGRGPHAPARCGHGDPPLGVYPLLGGLWRDGRGAKRRLDRPGTGLRLAV